MASNTRTTKLESINTMLSTIGESPVNSLTGTLPTDATMAINILDEINREVQSQGWKFNSSYKATLSRDTNNKIPIGNDVMHIEFNHLRESRSSYDPVLRGAFLYNLVTESFIWDKNFDNVKVIFLLPFEDIIEQARRFITIRASRIFHDRTLGANALHRFSKEDELRALSFLKQAEAATADHNIFNSLDQFRTINRNGSIKINY
tara:strand:+ start:620 stop:1234 length:615 start_codon:yes stop_codon:yes gene_type:complete